MRLKKVGWSKKNGCIAARDGPGQGQQGGKAPAGSAALEAAAAEGHKATEAHLQHQQQQQEQDKGRQEEQQQEQLQQQQVPQGEHPEQQDEEEEGMGGHIAEMVDAVISTRLKGLVSDLLRWDKKEVGADGFSTLLDREQYQDYYVHTKQPLCLEVSYVPCWVT